MILISHRGNLDGLNPERENSPDYIDEAIAKGYDVEVDVWYYRVNQDWVWLGHDEPEYTVKKEWLLDRKNNLWIHCKNFNALTQLVNTELRIFYHEKEQYTILNNGLIWAHNIEEIDDRCIIPLLSRESVLEYNQAGFYGVCSDFIYDCEKKFND
tara:strand:- start:1777 stop:2241 length:465 start_codon:yes stop_codon:yes gene_type:complete